MQFPLPEISVTVNVPAVMYVWFGFMSAEVPASPKFQFAVAAAGTEVLVNAMGFPLQTTAGVAAKFATMF
jgi:hypothetical protein